MLSLCKNGSRNVTQASSYREALARRGTECKVPRFPGAIIGATTTSLPSAGSYGLLSPRRNEVTLKSERYLPSPKARDAASVWIYIKSS